MASGQRAGLLEVTYSARPDLLHQIRAAIHRQPDLESLFQNITEYHTHSSDTDGPDQKRRKTNNGSHVNTANDSGNDQVGEITTLLTMKDVSFSMPQRKKMHLSIVAAASDRSNKAHTFIRLTDPKTNDTDDQVPISAFTQILCLPVPEKPTKSFNYVFIPPPTSTRDAIVFTLPAGLIKTLEIPNVSRFATNDIVSSELPFSAVLEILLPEEDLDLTTPSSDEFKSIFPEPQRRSEPAYHVKAHIGTKDGYLFFLSTGIFFGFKKPLKFIPLESIESSAFTRAMSRTFALAVTYRLKGMEESEEVEFDQVDTQEFAGVSEYVTRHGLKDGSFAAGRKAKLLKKPAEGQTEEANGEEVDGRTELEKAEQELQDEEDEGEEDYDPDASDDDDDGSGVEEDDDQGEEEYEEGKERDLVGEELGSEAEDVSDDGGEEDEEQKEGDFDEEEEEEDHEEENGVAVTRKSPLLPHRSPEQLRKTHATAMLVPKATTKAEPDPDDDDQL